mgnify:CR=1 FL=1
MWDYNFFDKTLMWQSASVKKKLLIYIKMIKNLSYLTYDCLEVVNKNKFGAKINVGIYIKDKRLKRGGWCCWPLEDSGVYIKYET